MVLRGRGRYRRTRRERANRAVGPSEPGLRAGHTRTRETTQTRWPSASPPPPPPSSARRSRPSPRPRAAPLGAFPARARGAAKLPHPRALGDERRANPPRTREDARRRDARGRDPARALEASRANAIESRALARDARLATATPARPRPNDRRVDPPRKRTRDERLRRFFSSRTSPSPSPSPSPSSPPRSSPLQRGRRQG